MPNTKAVNEKSRDIWEIKEDFEAYKRLTRCMNNPIHLQELKDYVASEKVEVKDIDELSQIMGFDKSKEKLN